MTPRLVAESARLAGQPLLRGQTDRRLIDLVRMGNDRAFEAIVDRYRTPLLRYCGRLLPRARAEDAVQQTFVNAYAAMTRDDAELDLRPWLYRIARNASLNALRENGWSHEQIDHLPRGAESAHDVVERRAELRAVMAAVHTLPARQRDAVILREFEGRSYDEIAATLDSSDGAVRQLLNRARNTLRAGLTAVTPMTLLGHVATPRAQRVVGGITQTAGNEGLGMTAACAVVIVATSLGFLGGISLTPRASAGGTSVPRAETRAGAAHVLRPVSGGMVAQTGVAAPRPGGSFGLPTAGAYHLPAGTGPPAVPPGTEPRTGARPATASAPDPAANEETGWGLPASSGSALAALAPSIVRTVVHGVERQVTARIVQAAGQVLGAATRFGLQPEAALVPVEAGPDRTAASRRRSAATGTVMPGATAQPGRGAGPVASANVPPGAERTGSTPPGAPESATQSDKGDEAPSARSENDRGSPPPDDQNDDSQDQSDHSDNDDGSRANLRTHRR